MEIFELTVQFASVAVVGGFLCLMAASAALGAIMAPASDEVDR